MLMDVDEGESMIKLGIVHGDWKLTCNSGPIFYGLLLIDGANKSEDAPQ